MDFDKIHEDWEKEAPELAGIERKNPFTVPENYFESLTQNIEAAVLVEQLKEEVSNDGFTVPDNYFLTLENRISSRIFSNQEQDIPVRKLSTKWLTYAAAACVTIAVGFGIFFNKRNTNFDTELSRIPDSEIVNYLQANTDASDTPVIIENIGSTIELPDIQTEASPEELEQYINSTTL